MAKLAALLVYPLVLLGRVLNALLGRDPLRLRRPPPGSLWIARGEPGRASYFREASDWEGRGNAGFGRIATRVLVAISAAFRPAAGVESAGRASPGARRDIPDEIYTLW